MATETVTPVAPRNYDPAPQVQPGAQVSAALVAQYLGVVKDITGGLYSVLRISERCVTANCLDGMSAPVDNYELGCLQRLALRGAELIEDESEQLERLLTGADVNDGRKQAGAHRG